MRILIVEDEYNMTRVLEMRLERAGLEATATMLGEEAIELAAIYEYDLILLDMNLPDMHGSEVLRALRDKRIATPVLVLTGDGGIDHRLRSFGLGADDFLPKPFHGEELIARIRAIVRRSHGHAASKVQIGRLLINLDEKIAQVDGKPLKLSGREYQILEVLALRKGAAVTKEALFNNIYGGLDEPDPKVIDVYICKIRRKLKDALGPEAHVETVWGRGYRLPIPGRSVAFVAA